MRCLSEFQQVYRDVASRHDCILIDSQSYFHAIGRHGLLDDELFQDAMHPSLRGQIALAQAVLQQLRASTAGWAKETPTPVIDPRNAPPTSVSARPPGESSVCGGSSSTAWRPP